MHFAKAKQRRRHAALSCLCALALALGTAVPYLAWAEGEAIDQPILEVSDAPGPDDGALPEAGSADGGEAPGGAASEGEPGDAVVEEAASADNPDQAPVAEDPGEDGEPTAGADANGQSGASQEGAEKGEPEAGDIGTSEKPTALAATPDAAEEAPAEATLTFYGPGKTEKKVPAGTVLTAADLPSAPATCTFDLWCEGSLTGTFAGWYVGTVKDGKPALYSDRALGQENPDQYTQVPSIYTGDWSIATQGWESYVKAEGLAADRDMAVFPLYRASWSNVTIDGCKVNASGFVSRGDYRGWMVPNGYYLTKSDVKILTDATRERGFAGEKLNFLGFFDPAVLADSSYIDLSEVEPLTMADLTQKCWASEEFAEGTILALYGDGDPFEFPDEETDDDAPALTVTGGTGIKASGKLSGPNVPEGADIEVGTSKVTSGAAYDDLDAAVPDRIGDIFEVTLLVNGKEVHDGFGELAISMPVGAGYNGHVIVVYHRHQDGSVTTSRAVAKGGYVTFTVTDLSAFALADGGLPADDGETGAATAPDPGDDGEKADAGKAAPRGPLAQTGDAAPVLALIALASAAAGAAVFAGLGARARRGRR